MATKNFSPPLLSTLDNKVTYIADGLYVCVSKSGNDQTADGTVSKPFLTIQAAIDYTCSKATKGGKLISIGDGVYSEALQIVGAGHIQIVGTSGNRDNVIISPPTESLGIILYGVTRFQISCLTIKMPSNSNKTAIYVIGGSLQATELALISEGTANYGVLLAYGASGSIISSKISNYTYALGSEWGSILYAGDLTGSGNSIVFRAAGASLYRYGTTPTGVTLTSAINGGQIFS